MEESLEIKNEHISCEDHKHLILTAELQTRAI